MDINSLPVETFIQILTKADGFTVGKCRRVCKSWMTTIDEADCLWEKICRKEYRNASWIAKKKSSNDCKWYHIYKNLTMWSKVATMNKNVREFYKFCFPDQVHSLEINYGVLPLIDTRGIVLYDMKSMKYIPVVVPERNCLKIANNDYATVVLVPSGILLQRSTERLIFMTEAFFKADNFVLSGEVLYFYNKNRVYKCDLTMANLESKLILDCNYNIKQMQYNNGTVTLFTDCGKILTITKDSLTSVKSINCPPEWLRQIKHVCAINDRNFVCYSRNLFKVETDEYRHLYLDFPHITALFFYGDCILIGTKNGQILLYRLSSQIYKAKPIFEEIGFLPDGRHAVQLDVCERKTGPVIVATTFMEIYVVEIDFFPHEKDPSTSFPTNKLFMYKRLLILRDRLRLGVPPFVSAA